jgi:hypothetical protein
MPAKRIRIFVLLALVVGLAGVVGAVYLNRAVPTTQATWPGLPYQSEDEWIVSQTATSVIDLAQFARNAAPEPLSKLAISRMRTDPAQPGLLFRVGARDVAISLKTHVWDPDAYVELARAEGASTSMPAARGNDDIVPALLDLKLETLRLQNDAVSIALQKDYRNPANHEAASLLLGVFALREASGYFYDPRLVLSRAAAHLAIARAMRGASSQPSAAGQLAGILIEVNAGRMGPAMKALDAFERASTSPAVQAWSRALRRRATLDWRVPVEDGAPLVERLEYMRSLARMVGVSRSLQYITTHDVEAIPDWGWRTMDFPMSVENGHAFVNDTISRTLVEAAQVLRVSSSSSASDITADLSREPAVSSIGRSAARGIEVLDEGTWSAFYQRELAHVAMEGSDFYRALLGLPEGATEFENRIDALMAGTPLWPIVMRLRLESECRCGFDEKKRARIEATYRETMAHVIPLIKDKPQLMPYLAWSWVAKPPPTIRAIDTPQRSLWFRTVFPTGTVFESRRINGQPVLPDDFDRNANAIHELSPWDPNITINWSIVRCHPNRCTSEQERANFANIADYSLTTMRKFATKGPDPVASLRDLCTLSAGDCSTLGNWLLLHDRFPEAAAAFQEFFDRELDRVGASNGVEWLVRYYQKTGRLKDALRVANAAAEVGSGAGMKALAGVEERRGNLRSAEALYRAMFERYDDGTRLLAFALRRADATGTPPSIPEYAALMERYFEGGLEPVTTSALAGPPAKGLFVRETSEWDDRFGIRKGDIIVAVDGVRVWKGQQEQILYARSFSPSVRYTVWRGNDYVEVEGPFREYLYGPGRLDEFPPRRPDGPARSH